MDELLKTYWPQIVAIATVIVWAVRVEANGRAERQSRIAADNRIEERIETSNNHHRERADIVSKTMDEMKHTQTEMLATLHNVEIGITAIREYRKGQEDARKGSR